MKNLYKVKIRHHFANGGYGDYTVPIEAENSDEAISMCLGPGRRVLDIKKTLRLNHIQVVGVILLACLMVYIGFWFFTAN